MIAKDIKMVCDFKASLSMYRFRTLFIHKYIYKSRSKKMLHVVHYIRATNINISTDLSVRMRFKLFEKSSFSIKAIVIAENYFVKIF